MPLQRLNIKDLARHGLILVPQACDPLRLGERDCDTVASDWNQRKGTDCLYVKISIDLIYASIKIVMENCLSYKVQSFIGISDYL